MENAQELFLTQKQQSNKDSKYNYASLKDQPQYKEATPKQTHTSIHFIPNNMSLKKFKQKPQNVGQSSKASHTKKLQKFINLQLHNRTERCSVDQNKINFDVLFEKGIQSQQVQEYQYAIDYYQKAEILDQTKPRLYQRMIKVCQRLSRIQGAKKQADKLIQLDPKAAEMQTALRIEQKQLKDSINQRFKIKLKPYISNPMRFGRNKDQKHPVQQPKNQFYLKDKKIEEAEKLEHKFYSQKKSRENSICTNRKSHMSANRKHIQNLKSKSPLKVQNPLLYPYSAVGFIISIFQIEGKRVSQKGTGCLIGTNLVLTAAHNIYNVAEELQSEEISYVPAPQFAQGTAYRAKKCFVPLQFKAKSEYQMLTSQNPGNLYDYALIQLDTHQNLQGKYGSLSYDFSWQQTSQHLKRLNESKIIEKIKILSFPAKNIQEFQFTQFQGDVFVDANYLIYKHNTTRGVSGAPNIEFVDKQYFVRAVHQRDVQNQTKVFNSKASLQLRSDMFESLKQSFIYPVASYHLSQWTGSMKQYQTKAIIEEIRKKQKQSKNKETNKIQINLNRRNIGPQGCQDLASAHLSNLQTLYLDYNNIGDQGCRHLVSARWVNLQILYIGKNNIGDEGCRHLASAQWFNLQTIYLGENSIGDEGCKHLALAQWINLQTLYIGNNKLGDEGCRYLASTEWLNLQQLHIGQNKIGDQGCLHLVQAQWAKLQTLWISFNQIGDAGCRYLAKGKWSNLRVLQLSGNDNIGDESINMLKKLNIPVSF